LALRKASRESWVWVREISLDNLKNYANIVSVAGGEEVRRLWKSWAEPMKFNNDQRKKLSDIAEKLGITVFLASIGDDR